METPAPPNADAPLPWLGNAVGTVRQPWAADDTTLSVRFPFTDRDYIYASLRQSQRMWGLYVAMILFQPGMQVLVHYLKPHKFSGSPRQLLISFLLGLIAIIVPQFLLHWHILSVTRRSMKGKTKQFFLSRSGVGTVFDLPKTPNFRAAIRWSEIGSVDRGQGGAFVCKRRSLQAVHVPGNAFADADAADRFYNALITLWQTDGDMDAVPEAVRQEFAPHE